MHAFKNGLAKSRAVIARHGIFPMVRIWLLAALLVLDAAFPLAVRGENPGVGKEKHDEATIKLSERQVDAGKFVVSEVQGGTLSIVRMMQQRIEHHIRDG